jgi:glucosamine-6-phosphate deaminase
MPFAPHRSDVQRFENEDALAAALASRVLDAIVANPTLVLGLPTGRTPLALYRELRERSSLSHRSSPGSARAKADLSRRSSPGSARAKADWSGVRTFNVDEFAGLDANHPGSYRAFMQVELFDHVAIVPANIGMLNGRAPDLKAECRRYEDAIAAAGGIDLQILGIGANGHIGFNEPADGLCAHTHIADLEQESREANAQLFGGDWTAVPARALSMGMATILGARAIVLMATGAEKADAVYGMLEGLITPKLPASFLQVHPRVTVMLDEAAATRLSAL